MCPELRPGLYPQRSIQMSHPQSSIANKILPQFILKPLCFLALFLLVCVGKTLADDCTLPIFGAPLHFSNGATTVVTAIADFNNDGILNIAATAHDPSFFGLFLLHRTGHLTRHTPLPA